MSRIEDYFARVGPDYLDSRPQFLIDSEPGYWKPFPEFRESVEDVLSRSLLQRDGGPALHMTTPYPWLDIVLVFISTTTATAVLSKLSEDIYEHFKGKLLGRRHHDEISPPMRLTVEIKMKKTFLVKGEMSCSQYDDAVQALASLSQMFADAKATKAREFQQVDEYRRHEVERLDEYDKEEVNGIISTAPKPPLISYTYDIHNKRWTPKA